ncbi:hypothetical protein FHR81_001058 [Actinoalloteichus hoggarensis]|nr:hypothetical protein [Actinoalloteichus hoggarensis]MBB5920028.1 hypothetical protein [Actinoalloteichus hoggarensis]
MPTPSTSSLGKAALRARPHPPVLHGQIGTTSPDRLNVAAFTLGEHAT